MQPHDVIVVGGSFAGLSAAMQLARARRRVLVVDAGRPRNRFAHAAHGFLGQDGRTPAQILETARAQLLAYPTVELRHDEAEHAAACDGALEVALASGGRARARRLVLATGVVDELPDLPGLRERWGASVLHCPYCHGYEVRDEPLGVLAGSPDGILDALAHAHLVRQWSTDVVLFRNGSPLTVLHREQLAARGIRVVDEPVEGLVVEDDRLTGVALAGGRVVPRTAVFVRPTFVANDTLLSQSRNHRWLVNQAAVECSHRAGAMVGRRMRLPVEGHILGNPVIPYVRTHLFVLPAVHDLLAPDGQVVALVKPQFEAGREDVPRGGVVRDPATHARVLRRVIEDTRRIGLEPRALERSPIAGGDGNVEFLLHLVRDGATVELEDRVRELTESAGSGERV